MDIHPESARMFQVDEEVEKAKNAAFRLLSGRAYTRLEIQRKLRGRRFGNRVVDEVIGILERLALIDDVDFARRWVAERMRIRPMGRPMLAQDLKRRGVAAEVVDRVLDEALAEVDMAEVALDLLRSRQGRYRGLGRQKAISRMYAFLGRRGFDGTVAREAAECVWTALGEGTEENALWEE